MTTKNQLQTISTDKLHTISGGAEFERRCITNDRYDGCSGMQEQWRNTTTGQEFKGPLPAGATIKK